MKKIISILLMISILMTMVASNTFANEQLPSNDSLELKIQTYLESFPEDSADKQMFLREIELLEDNNTLDETALDELYLRYRPIDVESLTEIEPVEIEITDESVDESTVIRISDEEAEQNAQEYQMLLDSYEEMLDGLSYEEAINLGFDETLMAEIQRRKILLEEGQGEISINLERPSGIKRTARVNSVDTHTTSKAPMVASGYSHNLYLRADGTVWTWGDQNNSTATKPRMDIYSVPTKIDSLSNIVEVAAISDYSLALDANGRVYAWGAFDGRGNGSRDPQMVSGLSDIIAIAAGLIKSVALRSDGTVYEWTTGAYCAQQIKYENGEPLTEIKAVAAGHNISHALKTDGTVLVWGYEAISGGGWNNNPIPVPAPGGNGVLTNVVALSSYFDTLALRSDGTVVTWSNYPAPSYVSPQVVMEQDQITPHYDIVAIYTGLNNRAFVKSDGSLYVWGGNNWRGGSNSSSTPVRQDDLSNPISIAFGTTHAVVVKEDGSVWAIGNNSSYQLGIGRKYHTLAEQMYNISDVVQIDSFANHSVAVKEDGTVWTWGDNVCGQLGDGTIQNRSIPVQVIDTNNQPLTDVVMAKACYWFSLALKSDGTVWAWGNSMFGSTGSGTNDQLRMATPVRVDTVDHELLSNIVSIDGGMFFGIAIDSEGYVWSWGFNSIGTLGLGDTVSRDYANKISNLSGIVDVSCGYTHTLALDENNEVWSWGYNAYGQLGIADPITYVDSPVKIQSLSNIRQISAGKEHSMAVAADGTLLVWGNNTSGQLGLGNNTNQFYPVASTLTNIIEASGGTSHSMALDADGTVWSWGSNQYDQLGRTTAQNVPNKVETPNGLLENVSHIAAGEYHSLALKNSGSIWSWGDNQYGQLGDGRNSYEQNWLRVMNVTPKIVQASSKLFHSLVLKTDGTVWASGYNDYGQLGINNNATNITTPVQVLSSDGNGYLDNIIAVEAGNNASYALSVDGKVYAWGRNDSGKLGQAISMPYTYIPMYVRGVGGNGQLSDIIAIDSGYAHTLALDSNGTVYAWGDNTYRQLGDGTGVQKDAPVVVSGLSNVIAIAAYGYHSLALTSDGTVYAWGQNDLGQIGTGATSTYVATPVPVKIDATTTLTDVKKISAGYTHNIVLRSDGTVWTWGHNDCGQLGDGTTTNSCYASQITSLSSVEAIAAGSRASYAITANGNIYAWGQNSDGKIGDGTTTNRLIPTTYYITAIINHVGTTLKIKSIDGSWNSSSAITANGSLLMWGTNSDGQFGIGSSENIALRPTAAYTTGITFNDYGSSFDEATQIRPNVMVPGEIARPNEEDYFVFNADFTGSHIVETTGDITVMMYNSARQQITPVNNTYSLTSGEQYYVKATKAQESTYTLIVRSLNPAPYFARYSFRSGFVNPTPITNLVSGYVEGNFVVANDYNEAKSVLIALALINKSNNAYMGLSLVEKTLQPFTSETVTLGLTVPGNADDYQLKAIIWDNRTTMNKLGNDIIFE